MSGHFEVRREGKTVYITPEVDDDLAEEVAYAGHLWRDAPTWKDRALAYENARQDIAEALTFELDYRQASRLLSKLESVVFRMDADRLIQKAEDRR